MSHVANFLNNHSLQTQAMNANLESVLSFGEKVVENEQFYYQARATALSAIAKWSPPDALLLIVNRMAEGESNDIVKLEMSALLNDSSFLLRAAEGIGIEPSALEEFPSADDGPDSWKQWRALALDHTT